MSGYYPLYVGAAYPASGGGGSGDMILASVQTVTGAKTFNDSTLLLANVAGTFSSKFTNTNTGARTYTLPDATGTVALISDLSSYATSTHVHGNITNAGAIGATANLPLITTTSGVVTVGAFGTSANSFCQGNDSRLSDARTPLAHVHAGADITTGTVDPARLGSGTSITTKFLRGDSTWQTITAGSGDALVANPLSQFAATTSAQLAGVISDETGSGVLVFATSPTLVTPNIGAATATSIKIANGSRTNNTLSFTGAADGVGEGAHRVQYGWGFGRADQDVTLVRLNLLNQGVTAPSIILASNTSIGFASGDAESSSPDILLLRNATGPAWKTQANGGLGVRNFADSADAPITCSNLTASGTVAIGGGTAIAKVLSATATLDFPSIASNDTHTLTMTVTGAVAGNAVFLGVPAALDANLIWCGLVTAADTVTIRMHNASGSSVDPASGTYRATVFQF